jgi:hypothetical protein
LLANQRRRELDDHDAVDRRGEAASASERDRSPGVEG